MYYWTITSQIASQDGLVSLANNKKICGMELLTQSRASSPKTFSAETFPPHAGKMYWERLRIRRGLK